MPTTPQRIKERTRSVTFEIDGETCTFTYAAEPVENVTQEQFEQWQQEMTASGEDAAAVAYLADLICQFVRKWDVVESIAEDGTLGPMWPLTVDRVATLDSTFLARVFFEMFKDAAAAKQLGTTA